MSPLCIFLCEDQAAYDRIRVNTKDAEYHRFFILSSNRIIRNNFSHNSFDNFMTYDYDLSRLDIIARLVTCYSHPTYTHLIIFWSREINFENQKNNFSNNEFFQNKDCLGFTRQYVALNGFQFQPIEKEISYDPIEFANNLSKALSEEPVGQDIFLLALDELIPSCELNDIESLPNHEQEIKNLLLRKKINSTSTYKIFYESYSENFKSAIVFSFSKIDSYKFAVRREDGLNCYIF